MMLLKVIWKGVFGLVLFMLRNLNSEFIDCNVISGLVILVMGIVVVFYLLLCIRL